ncbi:MAG: phospholipase D-like domain-containing protein [Ilumatobacteraceae bacterium]
MIGSERSDRHRRVLEALLGVPATEGNAVTLLRNGDRIFPAMLTAIREAERSIDLLTFVYWTGDIARQFALELAARAAAGVRVRVLLDAVGARRIDDELIDTMTGAGVDVRWFRPVRRGDVGDVAHRTHRKVLVVDETIGFTGGVGIAEEWTGDAGGPDEWRDTHVRIVGPAVDGLRAGFIGNWLEAADRLELDGIDRFPNHERAGATTAMIVRASAHVAHNDITTILEALLVLAEEQVLITTAYFSPDERLEQLLVDTARRGVRVEVLVPGVHADKRFVQLAGEESYERLLAGGVVVDCFEPSMLHAKVLTVDGTTAMLGSANVNSRSTVHDDEIALVVLDPRIVAELDEHRADDVVRSTRLDLEQWRERSTIQRVAEKVIDAIDDAL